MTRALIVYIAAALAAAALFLFVPDIDLRASAALYRPGEGFYLTDALAVRALYRAVPWLVTAQAVGLPLLMLLAWWRGPSDP